MISRRFGRSGRLCFHSRRTARVQPSKFFEAGVPAFLINVAGEEFLGFFEHPGANGLLMNRDAIGATVTLDACGRTQSDSVRNGGSFLSRNDPRLHFGSRRLQQDRSNQRRLAQRRNRDRPRRTAQQVHNDYRTKVANNKKPGSSCGRTHTNFRARTRAARLHLESYF